MKDIDPNKPIRRTTRMHEASPEEYAACIRQALKNDSIPIFIRSIICCMIICRTEKCPLWTPEQSSPAGQLNSSATSERITTNGG